MENNSNVIVLKPWQNQQDRVRLPNRVPGVRITNKGWVYMNTALRVALQHYHTGVTKFRVEVTQDTIRLVADPDGYTVGKSRKSGWHLSVMPLKTILPPSIYGKTMAAGVTAEGTVVVHFGDYVE